MGQGQLGNFWWWGRGAGAEAEKEEGEEDGISGESWRGHGRVRTIVAASRDEYGLRLLVWDERGMIRQYLKVEGLRKTVDAMENPARYGKGLGVYALS